MMGNQDDVETDVAKGSVNELAQSSPDPSGKMNFKLDEDENGWENDVRAVEFEAGNGPVLSESISVVESETFVEKILEEYSPVVDNDLKLNEGANGWENDLEAVKLEAGSDPVWEERISVVESEASVEHIHLGDVELKASNGAALQENINVTESVKFVEKVFGEFNNVGDSDMELDEIPNRRENDFGDVGGLEASNGFALPESINVVESETFVDTIFEEFKSVGDNENNGFQGAPVIDSGSSENISGRKRARTTYADDQPSVRVVYRSLTRASINKLEEFMQKWSQWDARHSSSESKSEEEALKSGEEIFFPALHIGSKESMSTVSFWIDDRGASDLSHTSSFKIDSPPLYDRGYMTGLTNLDQSSHLQGQLEEVEASRCFNCSSYNHSLKECTKPRDYAAVDNARRQHNLKRGATAGPRCPSRYYQSSPGGKFEGLKPGSLSVETRQSLGIGEHDPPPWLNRMREIGYPPGYLDVEEDTASGIAIIGDDEALDEREEDGEIRDKVAQEDTEVFIELPKAELATEKKKKTVEFPGINAPIPPSADEQLWSSSCSVDVGSQRSRSNGRGGIDIGGGHRDERRYWGNTDEPPPGTSSFESYYGSRYLNGGGSRDPSIAGGYNHGSRRSDPGRSVLDRGSSGHDSSRYRSDNYDAVSHSNNSRRPSQFSDRWNPNDQHHSSSDRHENHRYNR